MDLEDNCFPVAQMVKNLSAMWEAQVQSLGKDDPLVKGMATHSSILAWRISWIEEPCGLQSMGLQKVGHGWATITFIFFLKTIKILLFVPHSSVALFPPSSLLLFVHQRILWFRRAYSEGELSKLKKKKWKKERKKSVEYLQLAPRLNNEQKTFLAFYIQGTSAVCQIWLFGACLIKACTGKEIDTKLLFFPLWFLF